MLSFLQTIAEAQKRRENALQVIGDTIVFMEYLNRERGYKNDSKRVNRKTSKI